MMKRVLKQLPHTNDCNTINNTRYTIYLDMIKGAVSKCGKYRKGLYSNKNARKLNR